MVEEIEKIEGLQELPRSDGLINRVTGPFVRPRVRRAIVRKRGNVDRAGLAAIGLPVSGSGIRALVTAVQAAWARALFKAAVHHSRSSMNVWAGASSSANPASTSPPW